MGEIDTKYIGKTMNYQIIANLFLYSPFPDKYTPFQKTAIVRIFV